MLYLLFHRRLPTDWSSANPIGQSRTHAGTPNWRLELDLQPERHLGHQQNRFEVVPRLTLADKTSSIPSAMLCTGTKLIRGVCRRAFNGPLNMPKYRSGRRGRKYSRCLPCISASYWRRADSKAAWPLSNDAKLFHIFISAVKFTIISRAFRSTYHTIILCFRDLARRKHCQNGPRTDYCHHRPGRASLL